MEISNHYVVHQELTEYNRPNNIIELYFKNKQTNKFLRKEIRFVTTRGEFKGRVELDEGSQKVQTSVII